MSFTPIAKVYDRFNDLEVYERWLDFTLNMVDNQPNKVLDVACGTGWFTQLLAPFCEQITAFDLDDAMLQVAKEEQGNTSNVIYCQANMLDLSDFDTDYDLATCYADSLCFLDGEAEVAKAMQQVSQRLCAGGVFLFDVWTPYQVTTRFDGFNYFDSDDEYALLWDSEVSGETLEVSHFLTVFHRTDLNLYERTDTTLQERTYPLDTYLSLLQKASFSKVEVFVEYGQSLYNEHEHAQVDRWFFRCVK